MLTASDPELLETPWLGAAVAALEAVAAGTTTKVARYSCGQGACF